MEITAVRLRRPAGAAEGRVKALASLTIDDEFVVHELRVIEGPNGLFVSMPARRTGSGGYLDIAHPITAAMRERVQGTVLQAFEGWSGEAPAGAVAGD